MLFKRWRKELAFVVVAAVLILGAWFIVAREPSHAGQPLSYWLVKLKQGNHEEVAQAQVALRAMGKPAVSWLTHIITTRDSALKLKLLAYAPRYPVLKYFIRRTRQQSRAYAASALGEIGPAAHRALPGLEALCAEDNALVWPAATAAIMKISQQPLTPLIGALDDLDSTNWIQTALTVAEFGTNALAATPALCRALTENRYALREPAVLALGYIHSDAFTVVPLLRRAADRDPTSAAVWALGQFEGDAWSAIPLLKSKLTHSDNRVRRSCYRSLFLIMPADERQVLVPFLLEDIQSKDAEFRLLVRYYLNLIAPEEIVRVDARGITNR
jgi:HEAT repeat protein